MVVVTLEQLLFTDLTVEKSSTDSEAAVGKSDDENQLNHNVVQAQAFEKSPFELKNWPPAFEKTFFSRNTMQQSKKTVDHLLISDGFSSISVYFEAKGEKSVEGLRALGPVNSYSRVIDDYQITVAES